MKNYIKEDRIISITRPESNPIRRMIQKAQENGTLIDMTMGKKKRSVIFVDSEKGMKIITSYHTPGTLNGRIDKIKADQLLNKNASIISISSDELLSEDQQKQEAGMASAFA